MRGRAILCVLVWALPGCHGAAGRPAPVALCEAAVADSTWREAPVGDHFAIMVPSTMTDTRRSTAIPAGQQWWDQDLAVYWLNLGPGPWDSILTGQPGRAASQCSATAPRGWATYTFITIDGPTLDADVFMVPATRQDSTLTVHILGRGSKFGRAIAIAKSVHLSR